MGTVDGSEDVSIASLTASIEKKLKEKRRYSLNRCIYRVPNLLRQTNEEAFTPVLVSIGPLHHNDTRFLPMEAHKFKYLDSFLNNSHANSADLLSSCLGIVKGRETEIRDCYADPIDLHSDEFCVMVLVDSAFIIQLFRRIRGEDDYMYNKPFLVETVLRDIKLEENQLPFFILDQLYRVAFQTNATSSNDVPSFTDIVRASGFLKVGRRNESNVHRPASYLHLLDLLVFHHSPTSTSITDNEEEEEKSVVDIDDLIFPTATELHAAGVKFQVFNDDSSNLLDIQFEEKKGILKMSKLRVEDNTEYLCRNVIAFEQCHYGFGQTRYFTGYHFFLNWLINTPGDVQLLTKAGIIQNMVGSPQQVSDLINSLDTHAYISMEGYYYKKISLQLKRHCKKRWPRYRATLVHTYFKHPWAAISVGYAIALLLLTIAQLGIGIMAIP